MYRQTDRRVGTHHDGDLVVVLFGQVYQAQVIIQQVFQTSLKTPVGPDGSL